MMINKIFVASLALTLLFTTALNTNNATANRNKGIIVQNSKETLKSTVEGNKMSNIINGCFVAQQGTYVYYSNGGYQPISKLKTNGDGKFTFDYFGGYDINVVDGWIYYIAVSQVKGNELIKMKTDGTNRKKLLDAQFNFLYVKGEWLYYTVMDTGNLFKAKIDGTNITKLSDDNCRYVNIVGDIIYYSNASDNKKAYKIMNNKKYKITNETCSYINVVGDWIYFINESDGKKIYRIKTDREEKTAIIKQKCESLNVSGDWIYYTKLDDYNIHKAKLDGTRQVTIVTNFKTSTPCLSIFEDWIYYFSVADGYKICKIKADGTNKAVMG